MRAKRTPGRFNWMEVGYWCAYGAFTTFAIAYVMEKGAAAETMGFMAAAFTLGAFLGQFGTYPMGNADLRSLWTYKKQTRK